MTTATPADPTEGSLVNEARRHALLDRDAASTDDQSAAQPPPSLQPHEAVWPAWSLERPEDLARYLRRDVFQSRVHLPEWGAGDNLSRAKAVYDAIKRGGKDDPPIRYAFERDVLIDGAQVIRTPMEVLAYPRNGTCLDLALVLAAGMQFAGLPVSVLLVESGSGMERHALVAVRVDAAESDWWPTSSADTVVWPAPPPRFLRAVDDDPEGPGRIRVIDPNGLAVDLDTSPVVGLDTDFAAAVASGAEYVRTWAWRLGLVPGATVTPFRPADAPESNPLAALFNTSQASLTPLQFLRPEYRSVPFRRRAEETILESLAEAALESGSTQIVVVHGLGGSGKTRLALQVADTLAKQGWYAGSLPKGAAGVEWLAQVVTPLCVVVDYAEGRVGGPNTPSDLRQLLRALRARRPGLPTVLILTARQLTGGWREELTNVLTDYRSVFGVRELALPAAHTQSRDIYRSAYVVAREARLATGDSVGPAEPSSTPIAGPRWTTLDFVLLGWLAAATEGTLPQSKSSLYDTALEHEGNYWAGEYRNVRGDGGRTPRKPPRDRLLLAGAATTLVQAGEDDLDATLAHLPVLESNADERDATGQVLIQCVGGGESVAVRPDPVGDHLVLTRLGTAKRSKLLKLLTTRKRDWTRALTTLNRAGQNDFEAAVTAITSLLTARKKRWPIALDLALTQGGPTLAVLERDVRSDSPSLPLAAVSDAIPLTEFLSTPLGALVDEARLRQLRSKAAAVPAQAGADDSGSDSDLGAGPKDEAELLERLMHRRRLLGDRTGALAAIEEAVTLRRALAQAAPAVHTPDLAMSLNNLSVQRSENGDRPGALAAIEEAVTLYRALAQAAPAVYTPDLAMSLNNLSNRRSENGDRPGALAAIEEAVTLYRALAQAAPAVYTPDLAMSLNNLSNRRSENGDRPGALAAIEEAVTLYRALAQAAPAVYTPDLAMSLNNLSNRRSENGDRPGALAAIEEAVTLYRALAQAAPAVYTPDLAMSLNNLSNRRSENGDRPGALAAIEEAVTLRRALAQAAPAVYTPDLAMSLNNLSNRRSENGDRPGALAAIEEAVTLYRALAQAAPAVYTPDLAMSLNNLSNRRSENGDRPGALAAIEEAVTLYRALAQAAPAVYTPNLAMSLNNLSVRRSENGDRPGALAAIEEAVTLRRALAQAAPAVYTPDLAMSLNNLSVQRSENGDRPGALAAIEEAVTLYRALAQAAPAVYTPNLAMSLNNLSNRRSENGDRPGALAAIEEAVTLYRALAQAAPAVYTPDLAMSLNNLSVQRSENGDRPGALAAIEEAVTLRRALAQAAPAVYTPNLAMSLNNLSNRRSENGDRPGALAAIEEAVTLYRALAQAAPAVYTPDLAMSLNNLSVRRSENGDRPGALAAIEEAVTLYRALAQAAPAVYTPNLAMSLNNLSVQRSENGDRPGALAAIEEAVTLYRALAQAAPAVHTPDLAMSLNNLSNRLREGGASEEDSIRPWTTAMAELPHIAAAELRLALARRLGARQPDQGTSLLSAAAAAADSVDVATADRGTRLVALRLRRELRGYVQQDGSELSVADSEALPAWATLPLPEALFEALSTIGAQSGAQAYVDVLDHHPGVVLDPALAQQLAAVTTLMPEASQDADAMRALAAQVQSNGLDVVREGYADLLQRLDLIRSWIATETSAASKAFLADHEADLTDRWTRDILVGSDQEVARQHLAILDLTNDLGVDAAYAIVTDVDAAEDAAYRAIDTGSVLPQTGDDASDRPSHLAAILTASPLLRSGRPSAALAVVVDSLVRGEREGAQAVLDQLAADTLTTREVAAIHLKRLQSARPEITGITEARARLERDKA